MSIVQSRLDRTGLFRANSNIKPEEPSIPRDVQRWNDDNQPVMILRPKQPAVNVALASVAMKHQDVGALNEAVSGEMQFVGWLVVRGGKSQACWKDSVDDLRAGDVMTSESEVRRRG